MSILRWNDLKGQNLKWIYYKGWYRSNSISGKNLKENIEMVKACFMEEREDQKIGGGCNKELSELSVCMWQGFERSITMEVED